MTPIIRWLFERARSPLTKIIACTVIGALFGLIAFLKTSQAKSEDLAMAVGMGAFVGFLAAALLSCSDWVLRARARAMVRRGDALEVSEAIAKIRNRPKDGLDLIVMLFTAIGVIALLGLGIYLYINWAA